MSDKETINSKSIFALDIGTRSVIGVLGKQEGDQIKIEHIETQIHGKRVMYNGQIHDIDGVAQVVTKIKRALESKAGYTLSKVSIAVAGRSLKTHKVTVEREMDTTQEIDKQIVSSLEIEALQKAQHELENQSSENLKYLCVGHTVVYYYINDSIFTNPIGHRGNKIKVDILATFLPEAVVESLYSVTNKVKLEVDYMTLEPIAAIEVAVAENARLLNLALVDIGAGTSDIAITKEGRVIAYGMTAIAGDEITEEIALKYLLDFDEAERLKINLCKEKTQKFQDVIGVGHEIESQDILKNIEPVIKRVAKSIAENIISQNNNPPSAVFLIGGGSQIPNLNLFISQELNLPIERVAVRPIETIGKEVKIPDYISGPEYITPIGILVKTANSKELNYIEVFINDNRFKLFQTKDIRVKDGLVLSEYNPRKLIPERGQAITININNKEKILLGQYGDPAKILINGKEASLESIIKDGDIIRVISANSGPSSTYTLNDVIPLNNTFYINKKAFKQVYNYKINNIELNGQATLKDGDSIEYKAIKNIEDLCEYMDILYDEYDIEINSELAYIDDEIKNQDQISVELKPLKSNEKQLINHEEKTIKENKATISVKCNNSIIKIPKTENDIIFVDIFNHIDFDRRKVRGSLILTLNGKSANYTDILTNGDVMEIYWEE